MNWRFYPDNSLYFRTVTSTEKEEAFEAWSLSLVFGSASPEVHLLFQWRWSRLWRGSFASCSSWASPDPRLWSETVLFSISHLQILVWVLLLFLYLHFGCLLVCCLWIGLFLFDFMFLCGKVLILPYLVR